MPDMRELCNAVTAGDGYEQSLERTAAVVAAALDARCMIALLGDDERTLHPLALQPPGDLRGEEQVLEIPLEGRTGSIGVLYVYRRQDRGPFADDEVGFASVAAKLVALTVESAFLAEALEHASGRRAAYPRLQPPREPMSAERRTRSRLDALSERERDIFAKLALGYTNKEIADQLVLSVRTVEWHRSRIQWKLGVSSRAELMKVARDYGISGDPAQG